MEPDGFKWKPVDYYRVSEPEACPSSDEDDDRRNDETDKKED